jgi:acyl-coenzyme A synthetase/AMP-(fatty) acid ligase
MFRTGDISYRDANGYFYIVDRLKDMIVTGGENLGNHANAANGYHLKSGQRRV